MITTTDRPMRADERARLELMVPRSRIGRFFERLSYGRGLADRLEALFRADLEAARTEVVTIAAERVGRIDAEPHSLWLFESAVDGKLAVLASHPLEEVMDDGRGELFTAPAEARAPITVERAPRSGFIFQVVGGSQPPSVALPPAHVIVLGCEVLEGSLKDLHGALARCALASFPPAIR